MLACPILGETEPSTGLEGVIVVNPAHAGPTKVDVPNSAPLANVDFNVRKGNEIVASFRTDDLGRFRISLAPGHYIVSIKDGKRGIGRRGPFEVDIVAGQVKRVQWTCDTGMR
jgi:hypothetical protein